MRAVQLAIFVICIQVFGYIIASTGLFIGSYYEAEVMPDALGTVSAQSAQEQEAVSFDVLNALYDILTWGWVKQYFMPLYGNVQQVTDVVNALIWGLNGLSLSLIGIAFIQFMRNLTQPLQSG